MARAQIAYLNRKDVPARKALQEAVDQLGFKVTLDDSYAPFKNRKPRYGHRIPLGRRSARAACRARSLRGACQAIQRHRP